MGRARARGARHRPELTASLLLGKAFLLPHREQLAAAQPAVAAYRALADGRRLSTALMKLGDAFWAAGRLPEAEVALEEALELARGCGPSTLDCDRPHPTRDGSQSPR